MKLKDGRVALANFREKLVDVRFWTRADTTRLLLVLSTQGEYTKSKPGSENVKEFNGSRAIIANPATPTTKFTKLFKRLVNFLNLRKNMNKALLAQIWHSRFAQRPDASHALVSLKVQCSRVGA